MGNWKEDDGSDARGFVKNDCILLVSFSSSVREKSVLVSAGGEEISNWCTDSSSANYYQKN